MPESTGRSASLPTRDDVRRAPKVLLHDHLDGGLRPQTIIDLAADCGRDTWVWTGYGFEEALERAPWMRDPGHNVRMVIAGPYVQEKRDTSIPYMGSSNQQAWMRVGAIWFDVTGIKNPVTKSILRM
jgi:hypothetical protein